MSEPIQISRKHILLVDDEQDVRDTLKLLLELDEHAVVEAKNGREALEMFTQDPFDLVISDYMMPEMRGDELAANIKRLAPSQPILMLTGSLEMTEGCSPQVDAVLRKPFSLADLRRAIAGLCLAPGQPTVTSFRSDSPSAPITEDRSGREDCHRLLLWLTGMLCLVNLGAGQAWAGHLDKQWSGSIEFCDCAPNFVYGIIRDEQTFQSGGQPVKSWERVRSTLWLVSALRVISVDLADGDYTIGMRGYIDLSAEYGSIENTFQPTNSHVGCSWYLSLFARIKLDDPEGALSIDVGSDCNYTIALNGVHGFDDAQNSLSDTSETPAACGFVSLDEAQTTQTFTEDAQLQDTTTDPHSLVGGLEETSGAGAPAWYSDVVEQVILALRSFTPPLESASIALADPGFLRYYTSADCNLRRPSDGYWAGTITYTYRIASAITNAFPYAASQTVGTETDAALNNGTNGVVITLPEDGSAPSAHLFEHMVNDATRTVRAKETCGDGTVMPFNVDEDDPQSSDADGTLKSGVAVEIDTTALAGEHKATITIHQTPTIVETNTLAHDVTTFDGCHSTTHEHNSGTVPGVFQTGEMRLIAAVQCDKIQGSQSQVSGPSTETWTWDLHFVDSTSGAGAAAVRVPLKKGRRPLDRSPTPQAIPLIGGTIQCLFTGQQSLAFTVPDGVPQAGSTFQTDDAFQYSAYITNVVGTSFEATVQAWESSTNRGDTTQTMVCSESDGTTTTMTTNNIMVSFETTVVGSVTDIVPAAISATVQGEQYSVHVEIPEAKNGHRQTTWQISSQAGCAGDAPQPGGQSASDDWNSGRRVLDFHGTVNPADPTSLAGQIQMDHGSITWNLKTDVSSALRLSVEAVTNGMLLLSWDASPGVRLQAATSLTSQVWNDVPNTEGTNSASLPFAENAEFFRLMKQ